jgi:signal transduction histidine kinase
MIGLADHRLERDACARGFIRAAQYLASMAASADVLAESRELVRSIFAPDLVRFCPTQQGEDDLDLPAAAREVLRRAVDHVLETGFVAVETLETAPSMACAVLPVSVRGRTEAALLVGYTGERALPTHALDALLGVVGLVGAALARQRAEAELQALAAERTARAIAEVTERRTRLLSEASRALFDSFDYEATLASLARLLVPQLADWCAIELRHDERPTASRQIVGVHLDPSSPERIGELGARSDPDPPPVAAMVMASGKPELHPDVPEAALGEWVRDPEQVRLARRLGLASAMAVPMALRGGVFGAIVLGASSGRRFDKEDLALAEEIGRRAGTAIENARLYRQAQQAIGVRDQFLAIASHELKTPLTALMLVIEGVERSLERIPNAPPRMRSKITTLGRQGRRLGELVRNLLDISRIQAGILDVSVEQVDLCAVVREVVLRHEQDAARAGCALEVAAARPVVGAWNQSRVDQVVSNLLSNAIKYGAGRPVSLAAEAHADLARFTISDHGIGIAPEDHARIFERFERAVPAGAVEGMGLGLWITREIVAQLGGTIGVESRLGEGARFTVELPLDPVRPVKRR